MAGRLEYEPIGDEVASPVVMKQGEEWSWVQVQEVDALGNHIPRWRRMRMDIVLGKGTSGLTALPQGLFPLSELRRVLEPGDLNHLENAVRRQKRRRKG